MHVECFVGKIESIGKLFKTLLKWKNLIILFQYLSKNLFDVSITVDEFGMFVMVHCHVDVHDVTGDLLKVFHVVGFMAFEMTGEEKDFVLKTDAIRSFENVDLIPSNISLSGTETALFNCMSRESVLKRTIEPLRKQYDMILIDCMPSLGMMTINSLVAADSVIIPCEPSYLSVKGLDLLLHSIARVKRQINPSLEIDGVLLTMVDSRTNNARDVSAALREAMGININVFNIEIPRSVRATECPNAGESIFTHDPRGKVADAYSNLAKEVLDLERQTQVRSRPYGVR